MNESEQPPAFLLKPPYGALWAAWRRAQASMRPYYQEKGDGWRIRVIPTAQGSTMRVEVDFRRLEGGANGEH